MRPKQKELPSKGMIELVEEVFYLLRKAPPRVLASYCLGSFPFVLGLLFFWADMSKNAMAYSHAVRAALLLAVLFIWMKCWHCVYARYLWAEIRAEKSVIWSARSIFRLIVRQSILQPSGLFLLPLALIAGVPFGWAYAFYQNLTVLEDGQSSDLTDISRKSAQLSRPWQKQNWLIIWILSPYLMASAAAFFLVVSPVVRALTFELGQSLLYLFSIIIVIILIPFSPFGMIIGANLAIAVAILPAVFHTLTGIETRFTLGFGAMFNTTFFATICALTYLCMDPLSKAAYVLRNFYLCAQQTGEDLKVELKRNARGRATPVLLAVIMLAANFGKSNNVMAQDGATSTAATHLTVSASELNEALDHELLSWQYAWRAPRVRPAEDEKSISWNFAREIATTLADAGEWILRHTQPLVRWIENFIRWLRERAPNLRTEGKELKSISPFLRTAIYCLLGVFLIAVGVIIWRAWKNREKPSIAVHAEIVKAMPDIEKETTTAVELPEDGWLALARELMERGELRLALRALFLASLALLARHNFISIAVFKSNRDYKLELDRRKHSKPGLLDIFSQSAAVYESVWYGTHEPKQDLIHLLISNQEKLRAYGLDA